MIEWTPSLSVGIAEIDDHQRKVYAAAQRVVAGVGSDDKALAVLVGKLLDAARGLFAAEERALAEAGAPTLVRHTHEHRRFLQDIAAVEQFLERGQRDAVEALDLSRFVPSWLSSHVSRSDRDLARLTQKQAAATG